MYSSLSPMIKERQHSWDIIFSINREEFVLKPSRSTQTYYEIRVDGELGDMWADWFEGFSIRIESHSQSEYHTTVLYGTIPDQPALYAVLNKIRDLNLTLISIENCAEKYSRSS